jgi:beta-N-acetylglucosaminidase
MKPAKIQTGYIEGYYGRFLSWEQRADLVQRLGEGGGGVFLIASKEDPYHRQSWRLPYPKAWLQSLGALNRAAKTSGVQIIPGMAPGLSFDYTSEKDYADLVRKFQAFQKAGCTQLALLMDDIPPVLPEASKPFFKNLGEAHGALLQRLAQDLSAGQGGAHLWFCPTVYCDLFSEGGVEKDPYLQDLANHAPPGCPIFWTGKSIVPRAIRPADLRPLVRLFPNRVVLWDNLYAHDYCPLKIFLGPYLGRPHSLLSLLKGVLINPTGLPETDKLYLDQLHAWKRRLPAAKAWRQALERAEAPGALAELIRYLNLPQEPWNPSHYSSSAIAKARKKLKPLIWNWKSDLQREWYPYLFMLDADLRVAESQADKGAVPPLEPEWLRKRYTPVIAENLIQSNLRKSKPNKANA